MQKKLYKILEEFAEKVRLEYPNAKVLAFGSYVKGTESVDSDFDICVVIPHMQPNDRLAISDMAWEIGFDHDLHISTIVVSEKDFNQSANAANPLLNEIRNKAIAA